MIKKDDDLIIVSKDFTNLRYGYFKSAEILLFYRILLAGKNLKKDNNVIIEDFSIVQKDLEIKAKDLKEEIFAIQDNFLRTKIKYADRNGVGTIALFEGIYNNIKDNTIEAILTSRGKEFLQNLSDGYIRFLFTDVLKFKSKYSRLILPHLMNVSHLKKFIISKEKLLEIFEIEEKDGYNNLSNFNRVVLKAVQTDLKDIFEDFEIIKNKVGRTIKEYIFTWSNDFNFKKDFEKEKVIIEAEAEETEVTKIFKILKEKIPNFKIRKNDNDLINALEKRLEQETTEEITNDIIKNWHRVIEKKDCKDQSALLRHSIINRYQISNLTAKEIEQEKNILNQRGILHKEVKNVKSDWDSPKKEEAKQEVKKEVVKEEKKIEIISYKEYLERKEIELKKLTETFKTTGDKKLDLALRKMNFFNLFKGKIQVNLTKKECEQEIKNLKNYFESTSEIITQELEKISVIIEETKVADVEDVEAEEKANFKIFTIEEIEKVEKELEELKEWEDEISKLPAFLELDEIYYNLYCLHRDRNKFVNQFGAETETSVALDKEIADLESKRKKLELQLEEEKKELWDRKFSDSAKQKRNNIKSIKDFTVKVTEAKKEEAVADVKEVKKEEKVKEEELKELNLDDIVKDLF